MTHDEESEATRAALISAARHLIGKHGYQETKIGMVASAAGVTAGAIYHHFQSKKGLFQATVEAMQRELLAEAARVPGASRWERLLASYRLMLDRHSDEEIHRIVFVEAPHVIGPGQWEELAL